MTSIRAFLLRWIGKQPRDCKIPFFANIENPPEGGFRNQMMNVVDEVARGTEKEVVQPDFVGGCELDN